MRAAAQTLIGQTQVATAAAFYCFSLGDSTRQKGETESKLGVPLVYDKSYRINFSLLTPDLLEHSGKGKHREKHGLGKHGGKSLWGLVQL